MIAELVVDLVAIRANVERLKALVKPARYGAVVKANGYGHGIAPVARAIEDLVDLLCVYGANEALALRDAGTKAPILVMGPTEPHVLPDLLAAGAAITLWELGRFRSEVAKVARAREVRFPVHVKVETGVARLGFDAQTAAGATALLLADDDLDVRGIYTHLAAAEELESAFTHKQLETFRDILDPVAPLIRDRRIVRHAAASAAAMLYPSLRLDLVRAGIATYGIWPSPETREAVGHAIQLEPALTWTTQIVVVRDVDEGTPIGYGCSYRTTRDSRIAVLPIGYAEGLPRALSNAGEALVRGRRVRFVGRVCMNMAFVDVTDIEEAHVGDVVTLLGRDGKEHIDPNDLAAHAGTIGYEIVARLPAEVPRRYLTVPPSEVRPVSLRR